MMADRDFGERRTPEQVERELEETRSEISRTIAAIQHKVSPGQLANDAYGYLRDSGSGDFARNLGTAAKNNPVPVMLVGLGLAWLMMGRGTPGYLEQRGGASDHAPRGESGTSFGAALDTAGDYATSTKHTVSDGASRVRRGLFGFGRRAAAATGNARQAVGDRAAGASDRVREMSEDVRSLASEWSEGASGLADTARDQIHRAGESVQQQAMQMRGNTSQMFHDQPLIAGALGIAVGAVLGALLPLSRRENELMGETRDHLADQAMRYGGEAVEQAADAAKDIGSAAAEAAKGEAEKQGLVGDSSAPQQDEPRAQGGAPQQGSSGQVSSTGEKWSGGSPYANRSSSGASSGQSGPGQDPSGMKSS